MKSIDISKALAARWLAWLGDPSRCGVDGRSAKRVAKKGRLTW
jgi:hypothetical protein